MVIVLLANGFEELEAITPVDVLRRNNIDVRTVSITNEKLITGTHGIQIATDLIASDVPLDSIDMLVLPGGMPGVKNLDASPITKIFIDATLKNKGRLAAICAAPSIFGKHGMLTNIKATCFPGFEGEMLNAILTDADVVTDGVFTTARDYRSATAFADELVRVCDNLGIKPHDESEEPIEEEPSLEDILECIFDETIEESDPADEELSHYEPTESDDAEIAGDMKAIIDTLESFGVSASIKGIDMGPRIVRYELVPARGVKVTAITNLLGDLSLCLGKDGVRMEAPIPGKSAIGIEVPRRKPDTVFLKEMLECDEFLAYGSDTAVPIGKDVAGNPVIADVKKFPHALICGATGMGKSVCINSILTTLISKSNPEELKLLLIDPKKVEFRPYNKIRHLIAPIVTESLNAAAALMWATEEMEHRYDLIEAMNVRNCEAYNEKIKAGADGAIMPKIIIVIDELADLMMQHRDPIEDLIMRLAQKSRAAGIHLIIGTQRPSPTVITGAIKANIPTRISFKVTSQVDSRTIFDTKGAESLLSRGDMLYWPVTSAAPTRVQCAFITDDEIETMMSGFKSDDYAYDEAVVSAIAENAKKIIEKTRKHSFDDEQDGNITSDEQFLTAVDLVIHAGKASTSLLQRKLSIGYGKAAKYIDAMEEIGIIGEFNGQTPREVLITEDEWREKLERIQ